MSDIACRCSWVIYVLRRSTLLSQILCNVQMAIFLKISLSNFLSVFAARTTGYCWERIPGTLMTVCVVGALIISTILAMHWPFADGMTSISALVTIYVWFYVIFWFAVQVSSMCPRNRSEQHTSVVRPAYTSRGLRE